MTTRLFVAAAALVATGVLHAATITIVPTDPAGEGFNDPRPFTSVGGNNATTLGEARLNVFRAAAEQWGALLQSDVEIIVEANFEPFPDEDCDSNSGTLGAAGPNGFLADFPNAPVADTFYPIALANALAGSDLDPGVADISAQFNGAVDTDPNCLSGTQFYYGFDHNAQGDLDFYNVVMHEFGHGLGFFSGIDEDGANLADPQFLAFDRLVFDNSQNRYWDDMDQAQRGQSIVNDRGVGFDGTQSIAGATGQGLNVGNGADAAGRPLLFTPDPFDTGSSGSHWDTQATPSLLMEPFASSDVASNAGVDMTTCLFDDIGWTLAAGVGCPDAHAADTPPEISAISDQVIQSGQSTGAVNFTVTDNSRSTPDSMLTLSALTDNPALVPVQNVVFTGNTGARAVEVTPDGVNAGRADITVIVSDGLFTARTSFEAEVIGANGDRPPRAQTDGFSVLSTATLSGNVLVDNGSGADSDADGDSLTVVALEGAAGNVGTSVTTPGGSALQVDGNGALAYTPGGDIADLPPSQQQTEEFSYTISDGQGGTDVGTIRIIVTGDPGTDLHADRRQGATDIDVGATVSTTEGTINTSGDLDYFEFFLSERSDVRLETTGDTDTYGTLLDSFGVLITENDDIVLGVERNFRIETTLDRGTYYLEIRGFDQSVTGAYVLEAQATPNTSGGGGSDGGGSGAWTLALLPLIFGVRRRRR
ncbi:Ig-like domain-containing protein [uncultured Abyssibacter sp.]|uniref:Ig-like domain-containing protein n=1 Tax=uncultured Abyssibacter sp. TaxID=2320202 RepID=UPI0032B118E8